MRPLHVLRLLPFLKIAHGFAATESDAWPRHAHDGALTGRSLLHGNITKPQSRWSFSGAGRELLVEIRSAQGKHRIEFNVKSPLLKSDPNLVAPKPAMLDLDGSGALRPAIESFHERWAKILPDVKG